MRKRWRSSTRTSTTRCHGRSVLALVSIGRGPQEGLLGQGAAGTDEVQRHADQRLRQHNRLVQ